jgi:hypothetical protein
MRRITDTISNFHSQTATESQLNTVGKAGIFVFLSREVAQSVKTELPPVLIAGVSEKATAGQGPPKRRPPPQPDVKKSKATFSSLPPSTASVVKAFWSFLGQGSCKKGSKCKFSNDENVLAAFRKKKQSHSITIDSGLLTHCGGCSHCVGLVIFLLLNLLLLILGYLHIVKAVHIV